MSRGGRIKLTVLLGPRAFEIIDEPLPQLAGDELLVRVAIHEERP